MISPVKAEKSNVVYLQVLDVVSESKDTLMTILFDLHFCFIEGQRKEFLVLTADAKLYEVLLSLKVTGTHGPIHKSSYGRTSQTA